MKLVRDLTETITGVVAVTLVVSALWAIGHFGEPYLQWIPAVANLQIHAWYSVTAPASEGIGRSLYIGSFAAICLLLVVVIGFLSWVLMYHVRELGRFLLGHRNEGA
jgi:hypothetical protein